MATFNGVNIRLLSRVLADDVANSFWNTQTSTEQVSADHILYPFYFMLLLLSLLLSLNSYTFPPSLLYPSTAISSTLPYPTLPYPTFSSHTSPQGPPIGSVSIGGFQDFLQRGHTDALERKLQYASLLHSNSNSGAVNLLVRVFFSALKVEGGLLLLYCLPVCFLSTTILF